MRLCRLALRGVTTFSQPAVIDFDALGSGLVAFIGPNGAGKTTLLESVAGSVYKAFPTRSGWYEHCNGRDAYIETTFEDGDGHKIMARVQIDTDARKTEGYLFRDGESLTTGRSKEFEQQVEKRFGSWDLFLSSTFAAQSKAGNFLMLPRSQRKSLFVELLDLTRLEEFHEAAKTARQQMEADLQIARAQVDRLGADVARLPELEAEREAAQITVEAAAQSLHAARAAETSAQADAQRARTARQQLQALEQVVSSTMRAVTAATAELDNATAASPAARRTAALRLEGVRAQNPERREERAKDAHQEALRRIESRRRTLNEQIGRADAVAKAKADLAEAEQERERLTAGQRQADALFAESNIQGERARSVRERYEAEQRRIQRERDELSRRAGLLPSVPCTAASAPADLAASCPLLADARDAKAALERVAPDTIAALKSVADEAFLAASNIAAKAAALNKDVDQNKVLALDVRIKRLRSVVAEEGAIESARQQLAGLEEDEARAKKVLADELADAQKVRDAIAQQTEQIDLDLTDALIAAEERALAAKKALETARAEYEAAEQKVADFMDKTPDPTMAEEALAAASDARVRAEKDLRAEDQKLATVTARVNQLHAIRPQAEAAEAAARAAEQETGDWALVERALGRDGIQALEIDAAGPEVARLTNDLLEACYGPRFSISFETLREKKSSPGEFVEAFDVAVYDRGVERPAEALSGGERVIVGEALGLAISIFNARKGGVRHRTMYRDETAGALDPENAQRYIDLLRKAMAMGGFHQILFVSHQAEVNARADVRLVVENGHVSIEGAPAAREVEAVA